MNILNVLLKRSQYEDNIGFTFTAPKMTLGTVTVILYKLNSLDLLNKRKYSEYGS